MIILHIYMSDDEIQALEAAAKKQGLNLDDVMSMAEASMSVAPEAFFEFVSRLTNAEEGEFKATDLH